MLTKQPSVALWLSCAFMCTVIACRVLAGVCLSYSASPTIDEPSHLAAALTLLRHSRRDLYAVNPPLTRLVYGLAVQPDADWIWNVLDREAIARPAVGNRFEFSVGEELFTDNQEAAWFILERARVFGLIFVLLGGLGCAVWAYELGGCQSSCIAAVLWCADPLLVGHGALITPDVPASAIYVWAGYCLWKWSKKTTALRATLAGLLLGAATLTKFTAILLWPAWVLIACLTQCHGVIEANRRALLPKMLSGVIVLSVAWVVVLMGYRADGCMVPLRQYQFVSRWLSVQDRSQKIAGNRFRNSLVGSLPVPFPYDMVVGIDAQQADFERPWRCYLGGTWKNGGWWYFYFYAMTVKLPLGTLFLLFWALTPRVGVRLPWQNAVFLLTPPLVIVLAVSAQTAMTIHSRYLIPALPFLFVYVSQLVAGDEERLRLRSALAFTAVASVVVSSALAYPHSLSYFNEAAGGIRGGSYHLLDSNVDWGQELPAVKRWLDANPSEEPIYLAAYSTVDPRVIGIDFSLPPMARTQPVQTKVVPGRYVVSVNYLRGGNFAAPDGLGTRQYILGECFRELIRREPTAYIGGAFVVYDVVEVEASSKSLPVDSR